MRLIGDSGRDSAKLRDYSIAAFFIVATIGAIAFYFAVALMFSHSSDSPNIWSECRSDTNSVNVFIGATTEDLKNVKCTAVENGLFANPEIFLGNLSKGDEAICKFRLARSMSEPLSFEITYNNKTRKEVCDWQPLSGID